MTTSNQRISSDRPDAHLPSSGADSVCLQEVTECQTTDLTGRPSMPAILSSLHLDVSSAPLVCEPRPEFQSLKSVTPCFTPGTLIATPRGEVTVETLRPGDAVITRDNGIQEVRWKGSRTLNRMELADHFDMKPIVVKAGALGKDLPERDMLVSPQHRILIAGASPQQYFDETEVLVAAKHMVGQQGIGVVDTLRTTYIHFMFDRHEVILSDGAWTESFQPDDQSLGAMAQESRNEILSLFPELATSTGLKAYAAARPTLSADKAKLLQL